MGTEHCAAVGQGLVEERQSCDAGHAPPGGVGEGSGAVVALSLEGITKTFPGVTALDNVSLTVYAGETHAIVGENGAGKSTLMAITAGAMRPNSGRVEIVGTELTHASPTLARDLGLAIVYQHPALLPDLTIAENFWLSTRSGHRPSRRALVSWVAQELAAWGGSRRIDPTLPVRELEPDVQFIVEITKALAQRPRVLILDEPTEHLPADDVDVLFERIAALQASGTAILYISHRIDDVKRISSRVSVLRDGVLQGTFQTAEISEADIVKQVVGRSLDVIFPPRRAQQAGATPDAVEEEPLVEISDLTVHRLAKFSLKILPGEIVGLAGIEGSGQRELIRALAGLSRGSGSVKVAGESLRLGSNAAAANASIAYIPNDRHSEGIFPSLNVRENISLTRLTQFARAGVVNPLSERNWAKHQSESLNVRPPALHRKVENLSGGNQQKTVLARVLGSEPKLILADEPTQGVDVGARVEIYHFLREAVNKGASAIVVSSDAAELEGLCDRVIVMSRGHRVAELRGEDVTEHKMTEAVLMSTTSRDQPVTERVDTRLRRFFRGDYLPGVVLVLAIVALGIYTTMKSSAYLTGLSMGDLLTLFAALAFVAMAQQLVLLVGGIDLSVGPLAGLLVVVASFVLVSGRSPALFVLGFLLLLGIAIAVGFANWVPTLLGISPLLATLVTYTALQGVSLLLRPLPGGEISTSITDAISTKVGFMPVAAIVAIVLALALEFALKRTLWGVRIRAVGSKRTAAHGVGVRVSLILLSAYVGASLLVVLGGLMLMSQIGSGDPTAGTSYTLVSITAAVLGGASIFGGRGAFVGAALGALLVQQINTSVVFLNLTSDWQTYLIGGLTIVAAGFYSRMRVVAP